MKTTILAITLTLLCGNLFASNVQAINDTIILQKAGLDAPTILNYLNSKYSTYDLTATDVVQLNSAGVSPVVINMMLGKAATPVSTPAPAPTPVVQSSPQMDPDVNYFYGDLVQYGQWVMVDGNWFWKPSLVAATWRPYWDDGSWVYSDYGWYWSSSSPWAATYHYGRWFCSPAYGWIWRPDRVWGPAWVVWRSNDDVCGWAPMPPFTTISSEGAILFRGAAVSVNFEVSIGLSWTHFTFCAHNDLANQHRAYHDTDGRNFYGRTLPIQHPYTTSTINNRQVFVNQGVKPPEHTERYTVNEEWKDGPRGERHMEQVLPKENTINVQHPEGFKPQPRPLPVLRDNQPTHTGDNPAGPSRSRGDSNQLRGGQPGTSGNNPSQGKDWNH